MSANSYSLNTLLEANGAVRMRGQNNIWKLPNERKFVAPRTPTQRNQEASKQMLRGMLGDLYKEPSAPPPMRQLPEPEPEPEPLPTTPLPTTFAARFNQELVSLKEEYEALMEAAGEIDKRVKLMESMASVVDDPLTAMLLERVAAPPPTPPTPPPAPPQQIKRSIEIKRALVHAAVIAMPIGDFTMNDILDFMRNGAEIDDVERNRCRMALYAQMEQLIATGVIRKTQVGIGRRVAKYARADNAGTRVSL